MEWVPTTIQRAGKLIAVVHSICDEFEKQTAPKGHSDYHPFPSERLCYNFGATECRSSICNCFERQHKSFPFKCSLMDKLTRKEKVKRNINYMKSATTLIRMCEIHLQNLAHTKLGTTNHNTYIRILKSFPEKV